VLAANGPYDQADRTGCRDRPSVARHSIPSLGIGAAFEILVDDQSEAPATNNSGSRTERQKAIPVPRKSGRI
jgi:hypothetical protein